MPKSRDGVYGVQREREKAGAHAIRLISAHVNGIDMRKNKTKMIVGDGHDPYRNLAIEELLLLGVQDGEAMLYLWQNQRTVVIGRNQNAYRECDIAALEGDGGRLARRISGGGAVYHDLGNLNFTFLLPKQDYDLHRQLGVILAAIQALGIEAQFSGRNDILSQGRKFSGNAFYHTGRASFHHGTILVNTDMDAMRKYLNVPVQKMQSKGVDSVRSRVVNLCELVPSLGVDEVTNAMHRAFVGEYGGEGTLVHAKDLAQQSGFAPLYEKYQSPQWRLGKNPRFDVQLQTRFSWGGIELGLAIAGGIVDRANIYSDAMDADFISRMAQRLEGVEYSHKGLCDAMSDFSETEKSSLAAQVAQWMMDNTL